MTYSPKDERTIRLARSLFRWYAKPTQNDKWFAAEFNEADASAYFNASGMSYALILKRKLRSDGFPKEQEFLLHKWASSFSDEALITPEVAKSFLADYSGMFDHRIFSSECVLAGKTEASPQNSSFDFPVYYHANRTDWTLHLTTRGKVNYNAGNNVAAEVGGMVLIAPDANVHYSRAPEANEWVHYWAVFQPQPGWAELMQWPLRSYGLYSYHLQSESELLVTQQLFEELLKNSGVASSLSDLFKINILEQLLIRTQSAIAGRDLESTDPRVLEASEYIKENFNTNCSVAEIAARCNLSESRLSHLFQEYLGLGVQKYRNSLRLQTAKKLLATSSDPISHIANKVGFENPAEFSKFFSKNVGCSPRDYRATSLRLATNGSD